MGKNHSKLTPVQLADLRKLTRFERQEFKAWYKGFRRDCPSGELKRDDLARIYKQFFPFGDPRQFADHVFNLFDCDRNGVINFEEFICAVSISLHGRLDEKLKWSFQVYDIDRDRIIDRHEMLQIVQAIYKMAGQMVQLPEDENTPEKRVDKIFKTMDKNMDGKLTYEEFVEGSKRDPTIVKALSLR
jgi:neuronal calcium sensor 1